MGETWFTADLHFGHRNIIALAYRPFETVEEMDDNLVERWNDSVRPEDTVWVLGDVAMGNINRTLPIVSHLHGSKILVPGNHDGCWPGHKRWRQYVKKYEAVGFDIKPPNLLLQDAPTFGDFMGAWVCHFPYRGDHTAEDRYQEHRPTDCGLLLLHGHVHNAWKFNGRQINVGVDQWEYTPVKLDTLLSEYRVYSSQMPANAKE